MRDNRKHPRIATRLRCWCEGENVTVYARVVNLSEGGLFLRTNTPLERGTRAHLRLAGPDAREVRADATVMWTRLDEALGPPGMGLQFEPLPETTRARLRSVLHAEMMATPSVFVEP